MGAEQWDNRTTVDEGLKTVVVIVQNKGDLLCSHVRWLCGLLCLASSWKSFLGISHCFWCGWPLCNFLNRNNTSAPNGLPSKFTLCVTNSSRRGDDPY